MKGKYRYITYEQRQVMAEMWAEGSRPLDIAAALGVHTATIYNELKRGETGKDGSGRVIYSAEQAQREVTRGFKRRGRRKAG